MREPLVAVASRSFSANARLRGELLAAFPNCRFNEEGGRLEGDALAGFLNDAAGAIVGVERIDRPLLERLPQLKVVSKYGVGLDSIDLDGLAEHGVLLAWTPGTNAAAVAELALLHMLATLRRVPEGLARVNRREWAPLTGRLLAGSTVGLVGVGHVGRTLAALLEPFGCDLLGYDVVPIDAPGVREVPLAELLARADVVTLHVPLTPATRHLIGEAELALMKPDAVLVNTARGGVVDEAALMHALRDGRLFAAGLDVLESEPPTTWEAAEIETVFLTPHLAGSSEQSNLAMGRAAVRGLVDNRAALVG
ncbi:MAG: NAD(P)-dependent oxidoreductase [Actinomycetota bacterium]|nr:NAD(P)-dependent oxidoreductase [Actinomycetota bacterium]